jgi:hypothetical protein
VRIESNDVTRAWLTLDFSEYYVILSILSRSRCGIYDKQVLYTTSILRIFIGKWRALAVEGRVLVRPFKSSEGYPGSSRLSMRYWRCTAPLHQRPSGANHRIVNTIGKCRRWKYGSWCVHICPPNLSLADIDHTWPLVAIRSPSIRGHRAHHRIVNTDITETRHRSAVSDLSDIIRAHSKAQL